MRKQAEAASHPSCPRPHLLQPQSESCAALYAVIQHLPCSTLVLSDLTVKSAASGELLYRSASFSNQRSFDECVGPVLPAATPLLVVGVAAGFSQQSQCGTFDAVRIGFELTLTEAESTASQSDTTRPADANTAVLSTPAPPRTAQVTDDSVQLTTSFRLLADFSVPISQSCSD
jgi:hypothetical protein